MNLVKLGPEIGSRLNIWQKVYVWFSDNNFEFLTSAERESIKQLANGKPWNECIPIDWWNLYSSIFDEYETIALDEREKSKIEKDVPRTFTLFARSARYLRINFPSDMEPYHQALTMVLRLAAIDRGYCQGVNFIAAQLLLELADARQAFIVLSYLLKNCQLEILFDSRYSALFDYMRIFEKKLRKHNERLYKHFKRCEFRASSYAVEWFTTCFIVTCPGELALSVIDMILAGVNDIMIRMGLSLLTTLQHRLIRLDFEKLHESFKDYCMKADIVYVIVNALKVQFQINNSVLKAMAKKIESLDPTSEGDLKFGKSKLVSSHSSLISKVRNGKKIQKAKSQSSIADDDSLSSEGEIESEFHNLDGDDIVPIQLALHTPTFQDQIHTHELVLEDVDLTEPALEKEKPDLPHKPQNLKPTKSKFTIAITPKRFTHWKNLHQSRSNPIMDKEESKQEFDKKLKVAVHSRSNGHYKNHIKGGITETTKDFSSANQPPSIIQAFPEIQPHSEKTAQSTSLDSSRKLALIPPNNYRTATPNHSEKPDNNSSSRVSDNQYPTTASNSPTFSLPRQKDSQSVLKSDDLESPDVKAWAIPTRRFKRVRIWEQTTINSCEQEEATIRAFYEHDQYDSLLILHVLPVRWDSRSCSSDADEEVWRDVDSPKGEKSFLETITTFSPQKQKSTGNDVSSPVSSRSSSKQRLDSQGIGSPTQKEFIDQGGEVVSSGFYKRNHLIAQVFENDGIKEDYFMGKLQFEGGKKKSVRARRISTSHRHYQIKAQTKSKRPLTRAARAKTFPAEAAAARVNAVYRADPQQHINQDKDVLKQYAMYSSLSRVMYK